MSDEENQKDVNQEPSEEESASPSRFPEMDELQNDIARRIRDNQKFLDHFLDKDYPEEDDDDEEDDNDELFEEL